MSKELEDIRDDSLLTTNLDRRARSVSPVTSTSRVNGGVSRDNMPTENLSGESSDDDDGYEDMTTGYNNDFLRTFSFGIPHTTVLPKLKTPPGGFKIHRNMPPPRHVSNIYEDPLNMHQRDSLNSNDEDNEYVYPEVTGQRQETGSSNGTNSPVEENVNIYANSPLPDYYYTKEHDTASASSSGSKSSTRSLPKKIFQSTGDVADNTLFTSSTVGAKSNTVDPNLFSGLSSSVPELVANKVSAEPPPQKSIESPPRKKSNDSLISELQAGGLSLESPALHRISSIQNEPKFTTDFCEDSHKNKKVCSKNMSGLGIMLPTTLEQAGRFVS